MAHWTNRPSSYLTCLDCRLHCPHRVAWQAAQLTAACSLCGFARRVPTEWPWTELAARADYDILLASYERHPSPPTA